MDSIPFFLGMFAAFILGVLFGHWSEISWKDRWHNPPFVFWVMAILSLSFYLTAIATAIIGLVKLFF